ncbi:hypothetical protein QGN29_11430 [Temperatibacter marinus]|uniref:Uncharacterized protein n=1 Tax=Temperatibacter marinus TaxID=1456591 RepID=A0AA52ECB0_9PROT|nr:hypothetical protein [Temperatibacter marinus]WND02161.1 hypothetical protein QGN29_11430 [Temperatibacter marinus]
MTFAHIIALSIFLVIGAVAIYAIFQTLKSFVTFPRFPKVVALSELELRSLLPVQSSITRH